MPAERRFRAMGSDAHVIVVGGPGLLAREAENRIADLERRWSRFDDGSEVNALTRQAGSPVIVSTETRELVERAVAAWKMTGGLFDPTVLGALQRAGYDRSFELLGLAPRALPSELTTNAGAIEIGTDTVRLPRGSGFDAGGIGKGLAADIVADEIRAAGADGVCVNLGGDVRVDGISPSGDGWTVAVDYPRRAHAIARVGIAGGAVATSTTLRRRWHVGGELQHHLIDPVTDRPSETTVTFATVVAGHAWTAEVIAKALVLHGAPMPLDLLAANGAAALTVDHRGVVDASSGFAGYLAEALPDVVVADTLDWRAHAS